ncbi:DUF2975 domain-containing protein [Pedobacter miscanthi]|uniref:DUF2975 domain-containing protein n=1 Tax=Pedobacter miscanthi TaxID=2259170 RepID=A0A366KMS7_9SPHI|nr:DUF2975 domain-containing protein [Pedobacter miscanthi]RBQ02955.1 hypothetical protein DRW42_23750 [Pedobacter miscanthi]
MENLKRSKSLFGDIIGALVLVAICSLFIWMMLSTVVTGRSTGSNNDYESYELADPPSKYDLLDDSIIKLENNLNRLKSKTANIKSNLLPAVGFKYSGFLGVSSYTDTARKNKQTFIELSDFGLNQNSFDYRNSSKYYFKDGISHLQVPQLTEIGKHTYKISYTDKKVDYRYDPGSNVVLIPMLSDVGILTAKIFSVAVALVTCFIFMFGLLLILKFLIGISRNKIFEAINIRRLFWISMCCFTSVLLPYIVSGVLYLIYAKTLSDEVIYTKKLSGSDISLVMLGVLFIALYVAFKRGFKLKEENDLTI